MAAQAIDARARPPEGRALITGSGIGRAAALLFVEQGARVFACDDVAERAQRNEAEVRGRRGEAGTLAPCDLSDFAGRKRLTGADFAVDAGSTAW